MKTTRWLGGCVVVAMVSGGCLDILGHKDRKLDPALATGGTGGSGAAGGEGGAGATGGGGAGGAMACEPGAQQACYGGPPEAQGVGICKGGMSTCVEDGSGWGACEGEVLPAAETCKGKEDEDCNGVDCGLWARSFGDTAAQSAFSVAVDAAGDIYVAGAFEGAIEVGADNLMSAGMADFFVAKLAASGEPIWAKRFGDFQEQTAPRLAVTPSGDLVLLGQLNGTLDLGGPVQLVSTSDEDWFVAKLAPDGKHIWSRALQGATGLRFIFGLATDAAGSVVLAGSVLGTLDLGPDSVTSYANSHDVLLIKLAGSTGQVSWAKRFGGPPGEQASVVAADEANNIFVFGSFGDQIDFGNQSLTSSDGKDFFVAKFKPNGDNEWARLIVTGGNLDLPLALTTDSVGNVYAGGDFIGNLSAGGPIVSSMGLKDAYLVKFSAAGQHVWTRTFFSPGIESVRAVHSSGESDVILSVTVHEDLDFGGGTLVAGGAADFAIVKLDSAGGHVWSRRYGDAADQYAPSLATTLQGEIVLAGSYAGAVNFGDADLTCAGETDVFVAKLAP